MDVLNATEARNVPLYGYGFKSFTLSMIEAALEIGKGECRPEWIREILGFTREILRSEVELLPHVLETLEALKDRYTLMLITKGELSEQERKISSSDLAGYFTHIDILGDKSSDAYRDVLGTYGIEPSRFVMIGNSLRSDILPVVALGGRGVYIPCETSWVYEQVPDHQAAAASYEQLEHIGLLPDLIDSMSGV